MALARDFKATVRERLQRDPTNRQAFLEEDAEDLRSKGAFNFSGVVRKRQVDDRQGDLLEK